MATAPNQAWSWDVTWLRGLRASYGAGRGKPVKGRRNVGGGERGGVVGQDGVDTP